MLNKTTVKSTNRESLSFADYWQESYEHTPIDGSPILGNKDTTRRVVRSGSWSYYDFSCRVSTRGWSNADSRYDSVGFRLARY